MFEWITNLIEQYGYIAIALLMLLENIFPPIPSELIMPLAGFTAAQGDLDIGLTIAAGTAGSLLGTLVWYYIGAMIGTARLKRWTARHGRWLTMTPGEIDQASRWFIRRGGIAVFSGRLIPAVRTLISVPAGMSEMSFTRFLVFSSLGTAIWTALVAGAGYLLESQYQQVQAWLNPISNVIVASLVIAYVYRVYAFPHRSGEAGH